MKDEEIKYIETHFPEDDKELRRYRPLGAWRYLGWSVVFLIPVVGWVFLIYCALSNKRIARRSFARSYILTDVIVTAIWVVWLIVSVTTGS